MGGLNLQYVQQGGNLDLEMVVNIEGLAELDEALQAGSKRAATKFLRRVEIRAAKILKTALSEGAPYDQGELSEDIHIQIVKSDGALTARVGPSKATFYGMFQEFGAPEANVPALHWMELAAKAVQDAVLQEFMDGLTEGLEDMKG